MDVGIVFSIVPQTLSTAVTEVWSSVSFSRWQTQICPACCHHDVMFRWIQWGVGLVYELSWGVLLYELENRAVPLMQVVLSYFAVWVWLFDWSVYALWVVCMWSLCCLWVFCVWSMSGLWVFCLWSMSVLCVVCVSSVSGMCLVYLWLVSVQWVVCIWPVCGLLLLCEWSVCCFLVVYEWSVSLNSVIYNACLFQQYFF